MKATAEIGVIGGSKFYDLFEESKQFCINTPFGAPSDKISILDSFGKKIAFIPRHGKNHQLIPQLINYKANLWALRSLGVKKIMGVSMAGSLKKNIVPGDFVICDDLVNFTNARLDTFCDYSKRIHMSMEDVYCPELRKRVVDIVSSFQINYHTKATVVVINGPHFSTKAESNFFINNGWDIINMTQYPECYLAKELNMCYVSLSLITDYALGVKDVEEFSLERIIRECECSRKKLKNIVYDFIENVSIEQNECECKNTSIKATQFLTHKNHDLYDV
jgi:5'-methylthioadenosine phosphorylase